MVLEHDQGDRRGIDTMHLVQGVLALVVGALFLATLRATLYTILLFLGAFWLFRGLGFAALAAMEPRRWESRGAAAILSILASILLLQAPLFGTFPLTHSAVLFVGIQGMLVGSLEIITGYSDRQVPPVLLGWLNLSLGGLLLFYPLIGVTALPPAMALCSLIAGGLTVYFTSQLFLTKAS